MTLIEAIKFCIGIAIIYFLISKLVIERIRKDRQQEETWRNTKNYYDYNPTKSTSYQESDYYYDPYQPSQEAPKQTQQQDFTGCYEPRQLLTWNEWQQYKVLDEWAQKHRFKVLAKVRLADLIHPRSDAHKKKSLFWKIQAKHVDFVIVSTNMQVKCIVELMDNSHKAQDRQERDKFIQQVLNDCGYKTLFTYAPTEQQLNQICGIQTEE